mmetsp:Transcript_23473/g.36869  ORF Transcript_23473/g.36869 Transcript_23473/m.36869 type:complete len:99 (+) Transcript_23473:413-709(+)
MYRQRFHEHRLLFLVPKLQHKLQWHSNPDGIPDAGSIGNLPLSNPISNPISKPISNAIPLAFSDGISDTVSDAIPYSLPRIFSIRNLKLFLYLSGSIF